VPSLKSYLADPKRVFESARLMPPQVINRYLRNRGVLDRAGARFENLPFHLLTDTVQS
jgi:hypothetical protein